MENTEEHSGLEPKDVFRRKVERAVRTGEYTSEYPRGFFIRIFKPFGRGVPARISDPDRYHKVRDEFARIYVETLKSSGAKINPDSKFIKEYSETKSFVTEEMRFGAKEHEIYHKARGGCD